MDINAGSLGIFSEKCFSHYNSVYANSTSSDSINNLITGKVFTFYYSDVLKEGSTYINRRPLVFLVSNPVDRKNGVLIGIDLMLLTPRDRLNFFIRVCHIYKTPINQNLERIKNGEPGSQIPFFLDKEIMKALFLGINYDHAYKGYKIEKIKRLKEIPPDDWKNIIYLNTKSIEGINIEQIYNNFK